LCLGRIVASCERVLCVGGGLARIGQRHRWPLPERQLDRLAGEAIPQRPTAVAARLRDQIEPGSAVRYLDALVARLEVLDRLRGELLGHGDHRASLTSYLAA